jgi:outer membrane receptor protein involved in Fe transport
LPKRRRVSRTTRPQLTFGWRAVTAAALSAAIATSLSAQTGSEGFQRSERLVRGRVVAAGSAQAIADAVVVALGASHHASVRTGPAGGFRIGLAADTGTLVAARIGFAPESLRVSTGDSAIVFRLREVPLQLSPTVVTAERNFSAASSAEIRQLDIALRPRESSQELLRLVPGLVIAQHAGGGKAEQIFLRGFDADHGTDVAISVDGTPVNMASHAHGQGYADLHYLMPEVLDHVDVRKGPYDAEDGDLATAGTAAFVTKDRLDNATATVRGGSFDTFHAIALMPFGGDAVHPGGYVALSQHATNGPFDSPQKYGRTNFFGKFTTPIRDDVQFFGTADGFGAHWDASGQTPSRAVRDGLIGRFGSIDPTEGGFTQRYDVAIGLRSVGGAADHWEARVYAVRYTFSLFSDFTFFLRDTANGDEINQTDNRSEFGARAFRAGANKAFGLAGNWRLGIGDRADLMNVGLNHTVHRDILAHLESDQIRENNSYLWGDESIQLSDRVSLQLGARYDLFHFGVLDRLGPTGTSFVSSVVHGSGSQWHGIASPKANLTIDVAQGAQLFVNAGSGFHSNDARSVITATPTFVVLPRAVGAEIGGRRTWEGGTVSAAFWGMDLQSELAYDGDLGQDVASGATRRIGIDLEGRVRLLPWVWADADLNLAHGRYKDLPTGSNYIPLAPTIASTGGLTMRDHGPLSGGIRYRFIDSRPADPTNTVIAHGYCLSEFFARYEFRKLAVVGTVDNALDGKWSEAQFATTSRLRGEPPGGITDLAVTPGAPRTLQFGVEYRF